MRKWYNDVTKYEMRLIMQDKEVRCIYCNRSTKDGIKINESHIIPDAIVNKNITYKNVCSEKHNSDFGTTFESDVIEKMKLLTHFLGIYNKDKIIQPYSSHLKINGIRVEKKKFNQTKGILDNPVSVKENGIKSVLRKITQEQIDKYSDRIEIFDQLEVYEEFDFNEIISMLYSRSMLRLVAKIGYEWYCKVNQINGFHKEFEQIVKYIVETDYEGEELVSIVNDRTFQNELHKNFDNGAYVLWIDYSQQEKTFYTMFCFLGLVLYKVKIKTTPILIWSPLKAREITYIRRDGNESKTKIYFNNFDKMFYSIEPEIAVANQKKEIMEQLKDIVTKFAISIKGLKPFVEELKKYDLTSRHKVCERLQLVTDRMIQAVLVLEILGKKKDEYNYEQDFIMNTNNLIPTENQEYALEQGSRLEFLKMLLEQETILDNIKEGIAVYDKVYEREIKNN